MKTDEEKMFAEAAVADVPKEFLDLIADFMRFDEWYRRGIKPNVPICEVFTHISVFSAFLAVYLTTKHIASFGEDFLYRQGTIADLWGIFKNLEASKNRFSSIHEEIMLYIGDKTPRLRPETPIKEVFIVECYFYAFLEKLSGKFGLHLPKDLTHMDARGDFYRQKQIGHLIEACYGALPPGSPLA